MKFSLQRIWCNFWKELFGVCNSDAVYIVKSSPDAFRASLLSVQTQKSHSNLKNCTENVHCEQCLGVKCKNGWSQRVTRWGLWAGELALRIIECPELERTIKSNSSHVPKCSDAPRSTFFSSVWWKLTSGFKNGGGGIAVDRANVFWPLRCVSLRKLGC